MTTKLEAEVQVLQDRINALEVRLLSGDYHGNEERVQICITIEELYDELADLKLRMGQ